MSDFHKQLDQLMCNYNTIQRENIHWKTEYDRIKEEYNCFVTQATQQQKHLQEQLDQCRDEIRQYKTKSDLEELPLWNDYYSDIVDFLKSRYKSDDARTLQLELKDDLMALEKCEMDKNELKNALLACETDKNKLQDMLSRCREVFKRTSLELDECKAVKESLELQQKNLNTEIQSNLNKLGTIEAQLTSENRNLSEELNTCRKKLRDCFLRKNELENELTKTLQSTADLEELPLDNSYSELVHYLKSKYQTDDEIELLSKLKGDLTDKPWADFSYDLAKNKLSECIESLDKVKSDLNECIEKNDKMSLEREQLQDQIKSNLTKIAYIDDKFNKCSNTNLELSGELKLCKTNLKECHFRESKLKETQDELYEKLKISEQTIEQLTEQLNDFSHELKVEEQFNAKIKQLENDLFLKDVQLRELNQKLNECESKKREINDSYLDTEIKLSKCSVELDDAIKMNDRLEQENKECTNQIERNLQDLRYIGNKLTECSTKLLSEKQEFHDRLNVCYGKLNECIAKKKEIQRLHNKLSFQLRANQLKTKRLLKNLNEKSKADQSKNKPNEELSKKERLNDSKILTVLQRYYGDCKDCSYYLDKDLNELSIFREQAKELQSRMDLVNLEPNQIVDTLMKFCENATHYKHLNKIATFFNIIVDDRISDNVIHRTEHYRKQSEKLDFILQRLSWNENLEEEIQKLIALKDKLGCDWIDHLDNIYSQMQYMHKNYFSKIEFEKWINDFFKQIETIAKYISQKNRSIFNTKNWLSEAIPYFISAIEKCDYYARTLNQLAPDLEINDSWMDAFAARYNALLKAYEALQKPGLSINDFSTHLNTLKNFCSSLKPEILMHTNWLEVFLNETFTQLSKSKSYESDLQVQCEKLATDFGIYFNPHSFYSDIINSNRMQKILRIEKEVFELGVYFAMNGYEFTMNNVRERIEFHFQNRFGIQVDNTYSTNILILLDNYINSDRKEKRLIWENFYKECLAIIGISEMISKEDFKSELLKLKNVDESKRPLLKTKKKSDKSKQSSLKTTKKRLADKSNESPFEFEESYAAVAGPSSKSPSTLKRMKVTVEYIAQQELQNLFLALYKKLFECKAQLLTNIDINIDQKQIIDNKLNIIDKLEQEGATLERKSVILKIYQDYVKLDLETIAHKETSSIVFHVSDLLERCLDYSERYLNSLINGKEQEMNIDENKCEEEEL